MLLVPLPFWLRLTIGVVGMAALVFGGWTVIQTLKGVTGSGKPYIADKSTGCVYPEHYVRLKNSQEAGRFMPTDRQVSFPGLDAALKAGYRQCQN